MKSHHHVPDTESIHIFPSETVLTKSKWLKLSDGLKKHAGKDEKDDAQKILSEVLPQKRLKPGPKPSDVHSVTNRTRQHYFWLLREILNPALKSIVYDKTSDLAELTDLKTCEKTARVISAFIGMCGEGVFLKEKEFQEAEKTVADGLSLHSGNEIPVLNMFKKSLMIANSEFRAEKLFVEVLTRGREESSTNEKLSDFKAAVNLLQSTLQMEPGSSFTTLLKEKRRIRRDQRGRKRITRTEISGIGATADSQKEPESEDHSFQTPYKFTPLAATEEEIFKKAVSYLLMIKQTCYSSYYLPIPSSFITEIRHYDESCRGIRPTVDKLIDLLTCSTQGCLQTPWQLIGTSPEMTGCHDEILPFGVWKVLPRPSEGEEGKGNTVKDA